MTARKRPTARHRPAEMSPPAHVVTGLPDRPTQSVSGPYSGLPGGHQYSPGRTHESSTHRAKQEPMTAESPRDDAPEAFDLVLTIEEAARCLRIGRTLMYSLVSSGEVESVMIGRLRRVPIAALETYVSRLRTAGRAA